MEFFKRLFFLLLSVLIWTASATFLAYPAKVLWNNSVLIALGAPTITCRTSWATLLLVGWTVAVIKMPKQLREVRP